MRANASLRAASAGLLLLVTALAPPASAIDLGAVIANVAPTITGVTLSGLAGGALSPVAGGTASFTATVVASDANGASDVRGVTVGIVKPDGSTVHVAQSAATLAGTNGLLATYTKTLTMAYHDAAATGLSTYKVRATATDAGGLLHTSALTMAPFNYDGLVALGAPSAFELAAAAGGSSGATALSVSNLGNVPIDAQVSGTALTYGGASIPVGDIAWSLAGDMAGAVPLATSPASVSAFDLAPAGGAARPLYFELTPTVPAGGLPAGPYTGTLTVTAVSG